ncbi:hypothetical protein ACJJTC_018208 [Scirpophaga incertulas]
MVVWARCMGQTVAVVSVNGPLDIKTQSQNPYNSTLEVLFCSKIGRTSVADRCKENVIRQTCEAAILGSLYPRTGITVTVQELEDYGGLLACCLNCTCLALLNSGVSMQYLFAAVSCVVDERGDVVLDPTEQALATARARLTFVFDNRDKSLVTFFTDGTFSRDTQKEALERCRAASDLIFGFYRSIVGKYSNVI